MGDQFESHRVASSAEVAAHEWSQGAISVLRSRRRAAQLKTQTQRERLVARPDRRPLYLTNSPTLRRRYGLRSPVEQITMAAAGSGRENEAAHPEVYGMKAGQVVHAGSKRR